MYDDVRQKKERDYRVVLQNTNGIKEFRDSDLDYYPTMRALNNTGADLISLVETNKPWHKNDLLYDISTLHKTIWSTPTKTIGASNRLDKHCSSNYLPGGVLMTVANNLTTKIQSTETDNLGRWAKIRFFAKGGLLTAYSLYRPNPGSLSSSGANMVWMQHYRQQSKTNKTMNPRK